MKPRIAVAYSILITLGLLVRLIPAWIPIPDILRYKPVYDDAFYYLTIARNVVAGNGVSFDGIHQTNGFHPLYLLALVVIFLFVGTDITNLPVHLSLSLLAIFDVSAGILLSHLIYTLTRNRFASTLSLVYWLFNPGWLLISLGGLETPLYLFCVALALSFLYKHIHEIATSKHLSLLLGVLAAAVALSRIDGLLVMPLLALELYLLSRAGALSALRPLVSFFSGFALLFAPWMLWNLIHFATLVPTSGAAKVLFRRNEFLAGFPSGPSLIDYMRHYVSLFATANVQLGSSSSVGTLGLVLVILVGALSFLARPEHTRLAAEASIRPLLRLTGALGVATVTFYTVYFGSADSRYLSSCLLFITVSIALAFHYISAMSRNTLLTSARSFLSAVLLILIGGGALANHSRQIETLLKGESYMEYQATFQLAMTLNEIISTDQRIGSFNAPILGYFSRRPIINLDGVVNNKAYNALKERKLYQYLKQDEIRWIADFKSFVQGTSGSEKGFTWYDQSGRLESLIPVYTFQQEDRRNPMIVYAVP